MCASFNLDNNFYRDDNHLIAWKLFSLLDNKVVVAPYMERPYDVYRKHKFIIINKNNNMQKVNVFKDNPDIIVNRELGYHFNMYLRSNVYKSYIQVPVIIPFDDLQMVYDEKIVASSFMIYNPDNYFGINDEGHLIYNHKIGITICYNPDDILSGLNDIK